MLARPKTLEWLILCAEIKEKENVNFKGGLGPWKAIKLWHAWGVPF
jgi:hypothetical protein